MLPDPDVVPRASKSFIVIVPIEAPGRCCTAGRWSASSDVGQVEAEGHRPGVDDGLRDGLAVRSRRTIAGVRPTLGERRANCAGVSGVAPVLLENAAARPLASVFCELDDDALDAGEDRAVGAAHGAHLGVAERLGRRVAMRTAREQQRAGDGKAVLERVDRQCIGHFLRGSSNVPIAPIFDGRMRGEAPPFHPLKSAPGLPMAGRAAAGFRPSRRRRPRSTGRS